MRILVTCTLALALGCAAAGAEVANPLSDAGSWAEIRGDIVEHPEQIEMAGDRMTLADLAAGAAISVLDYLGEVDWTSEPSAREWYHRVKSRPAFRGLLADRVRRLPPASHYADLDF